MSRRPNAERRSSDHTSTSSSRPGAHNRSTNPALTPIDRMCSRSAGSPAGSPTQVV